ncbi:MAG TPA: DUF2785 domain-containing protein [Steroidobacteraceae bacterium]|nr:DUF2785 domain-containing protein [Steroidobacteraceae bacterium]
MNRAGVATLMLSAIVLAPGAGAESCPPAGMSRERLLELKSHEFAVADDARRQALALDLAGCLASTDPQLRDGVAFEALSAWMRDRKISPTTVGKLRDRLLQQLSPAEPDPAGVRRPFAALTLAEVARFDRVEQFMTDQQLQQLVDAGTGYLKSVDDYRGFDEREGWRHGVAHASDLMLQLAVNPRTSKAQLDQMLAAIAAQVAPAGEHSYIYGEGDRLAQAVFYIARRKLHTADEWRKWLEQVSAPAPLQSWRDAWISQRGIAKHQNTMQFLSMLYLYVRESGPEFEPLVLPAIVASIKPML